MLYSHLAAIWQFDSILNSVIIIGLGILDLQNKWFEVIMNHIKNLQMSHMSIHYPIVGAARMLLHFNSDLYLDLSNKVITIGHSYVNGRGIFRVKK